MAYYEGTTMRLTLGTKELFHEVDATLNFSLDFNEIASKDTNGKITTPGSYSWSIDCNMSLIDNDGTTQEDLHSLATKAIAKASHAITFSTNVTGDAIFSGNAYIEGFSVTAKKKKKATATFTLRGTGDLTVAEVSS